MSCTDVDWVPSMRPFRHIRSFHVARRRMSEFGWLALLWRMTLLGVEWEPLRCTAHFWHVTLTGVNLIVISMLRIFSVPDIFPCSQKLAARQDDARQRQFAYAMRQWGPIKMLVTLLLKSWHSLNDRFKVCSSSKNAHSPGVYGCTGVS